MSLENKAAIITGGAQGIGLAIARRFLDDGARVVIADKDEDAGGEAMSMLGELGAVRFIHCDVGDRLNVRNLVAATVDAFGQIDILVCNAASQPGDDRRLLVDLDEEKVVKRIPMLGGVHNVFISPDGRFVAAGMIGGCKVFLTHDRDLPSIGGFDAPHCTKLRGMA